jgi:hypothetical protein
MRLNKDIKAAGGFTWKAKFEASVKGDTKTVRCSWEVELMASGDEGTFTVGGRGIHSVDPADCR